MLRITLNDLRARRRRLAGTLIAVFLGVAFLSGTLLLGDTLKANFDSLFAQANAGTDAVVRTGSALDSDVGAMRGTLDPALLGRVRAVDGVAEAQPSIEGYGQLLGSDGKAVGGNGPPRIAGNWVADRRLNAYQLVAGHAPRASGEVVINRGAAEDGKLAIGDTTTLQTPAPHRVRIVGIAKFGSADGLGEETYAGLTLHDAQRYLLHGADRINSIKVAADPGVSQVRLAAALRAVIPARAEAITGSQLVRDNSDQIGDEFLDGLRTFLVIFAAIALLVATFSIANTFAISGAQRRRESALLRAVGASRAQVAGSLMIEALALGVIASAAGVLGGVGFATALKALFGVFGGALPDGGLVVKPAAVLIALGVGTLITTVAGVMPALRAGRTSPLEALRAAALEPGARGRSVGGRALALALRPLGGVAGTLAGRNAARNPRRTVRTASALIVGVTVVTLFTVFASSMKSSLQSGIERSFAGDLAVTAPSWGGGGLDPRLVQRIERLPGVRSAAGIGDGAASIGGRDEQVGIVDPAALRSLVDLEPTAGSLGDLGAGEIAVSRRAADSRGLELGGDVGVAYADGTSTRMRVAAIYDNSDIAGDYVLSRAAWAPHATQELDRSIFVELDPGTSLAAGQAAIERATRSDGAPDVETRAQYVDSAGAGFDMLLGVVYVMLALAIVIALMGIANTLSLSIHERTREIGLLRAVGASRRQVRTMIRGESVTIAALGALSGVALGIALSALLVPLVQTGPTGGLSLPATQLVAVAVVGSLAGALASVRPARRAARLDVLRAVAAQ